MILGLAYGYVPYMILPLYAGLDRLSQPMLEASRDLGANRVSSFLRVTLPLCRPTILAAVLLTCLPMLGDYFTNDLLSASPKTAMVGNLINDSVQAPGQTGQAGAFVMLVLSPRCCRCSTTCGSPCAVTRCGRDGRRFAPAVGIRGPSAGSAIRGDDRGSWPASPSSTWCGRCCRC